MQDEWYAEIKILWAKIHAQFLDQNWLTIGNTWDSHLNSGEISKTQDGETEVEMRMADIREELDEGGREEEKVEKGEGENTLRYIFPFP